MADILLAGSSQYSEEEDIRLMQRAIQQAKKAGQHGEVPIGAIVVRAGEIIGTGFNRRESALDPTAHAEMFAIQAAAQRLQNWRLENCNLYVTLEPCLMCAGAIILARIERVIFGCRDPKGGALGTLYDVSHDGRLNHAFSVTAGILENDCRNLLTSFFQSLRQKKKCAHRGGIASF
jgi:tRNA(adenine34) deaminase